MADTKDSDYLRIRYGEGQYFEFQTLLEQFDKLTKTGELTADLFEKLIDRTAKKGEVPKSLQGLSWLWPMFQVKGKSNNDLPRPWSGVAQNWKNIKGLDKEALKLLERMKRALPYKHDNEKKRIKLTPLVLYYLTRYLAPILASTESIKGGPTWSDCVWDNKSFHPERLKFDKLNKEERITQMLKPEELYSDEQSGIPINDLFPFSRIKTTYSKESNIEDDVEYGLLQRYYSTLDSASRKTFVDQVWNNLLCRLPEMATLGMGRTFVPEYSNAVAAFLQEVDDTTTNTKKLKMFTDMYEEEEVSIFTGAVLEIPGISILIAESEDNHNFFEATLPDSIESDIDLEGIDNFDGIDYLQNLIIELERHENADDYINHLYTLLENTYECSISIQRDGNLVNAVVVSMGEQSFSTTIHLSSPLKEKRTGQLLRASKTNEKKIANTMPNLDGSSMKHRGFDRKLVGLITVEELFGEIYKILKLDYSNNRNTDADAVRFFFFGNQPVTIGNFYCGEPNYLTDEIEGFMSIALTGGLPEAQEEPQEAKMFAALGDVVETLMVKHAIEASKGAKNSPVSNIYDEWLSSLLGNTRNPGLATYHALIHYNMLTAQLRTPLLSWAETSTSELVAGRLIAAESWLDDPAKLLNMWMMNYRGYINFGGWNSSTNSPIFFSLPVDPFLDKQSKTMMLNAFAKLAIAYYRMSFKMLSARPVFVAPVRSGTEEATSGKRDQSRRYAEIKKYWGALIKDSVNDPPKPGMFAMVLRFFADSKSTTGIDAAGEALITPYPTWMPAPPETFDKAELYKDNKMVTKFLKWAYGNKPMDMDNFSEISAAYHAAKVLSASDSYEELVRLFLDAVSDDHGHPFLYAVLLNKKSVADSSPPGKTPTKVEVTNLQNLDLTQVMGLGADEIEKMQARNVVEEEEEEEESYFTPEGVEPEDLIFREGDVEKQKTVVDSANELIEDDNYEEQTELEVEWDKFGNEVYKFIDGLVDQGKFDGDNMRKLAQVYTKWIKTQDYKKSPPSISVPELAKLLINDEVFER